MGSIIALQAASNLAPLRPVANARVEATLLVFDALALTGLLMLSGGPSNPFSALYFVQVTLAAILLRGFGPWLVWAAASTGYALLFVVDLGSSNTAHHHPAPGSTDALFASHLYGMFIAFAVSAAVITLFVSRLSDSLREQSQELAVTRDRVSQVQRAASLTTLAAGAAHELGSPLATIAVVARELERKADGEAADDARVIREEVERCKSILESMSRAAGTVAGEAPIRFPVNALLVELSEAWSRPQPLQLEPSGDEGTVAILPRRALKQTLQVLLDNASDASGPNAPIVLAFRDRSFQVIDHGAGMSAKVVERATDPFFSTKEPGKGMGLGLYLAQTTVDAMGATFSIESEPGRGTVATIELPSGAYAGQLE